MKKYLISGAVLVATIGVLLVVFVTNLGFYVERAIEHYGGAILGTQVKVDHVAIFPNQRRGTITGLTVANPIGYSERPAVSIAEISAAIDIQNRVTNKLIVKQPEIHIEVKGSSSNIQELADHAEAYQPGAQSGEEGDDESLEFRLIEIESARATMVTDFSDEVFEFKMDELRLTDLKGTREEIAVEIVRQLTEHIAFEAAKEILKEKARDKADELGEKFKDLINGDG